MITIRQKWPTEGSPRRDFEDWDYHLGVAVDDEYGPPGCQKLLLTLYQEAQVTLSDKRRADALVEFLRSLPGYDRRHFSVRSGRK
jgi:hypothetical protein